MTPHLARTAIIGTGQKPEIARMSRAQLCAISMLYETVAIESVMISEMTNLEDIEAVKKLAEKYRPETFMGMKIVIDDTIPNSVIEFEDDKSEVIGRVVNLAIPNGFEVPVD